MVKPMRIITFSDNMADQNSYLLIDKTEAVLIDPGFNGEKILQYLKESGSMLKKVLLTHGHFDHIRDTLFLRKHLDFTIYIHQNDYSFLYDEQKNYAKSFHSHFLLDRTYEVTKVNEGDQIPFGSSFVTVYHTPGHTAGSASYGMNKWLATGDILFVDSVGRTDLVTGSQKMLYESLRKIKNSFSKETEILPGHGPKAKLAEIIKVNPFLN